MFYNVILVLSSIVMILQAKNCDYASKAEDYEEIIEDFAEITTDASIDATILDVDYSDVEAKVLNVTSLYERTHCKKPASTPIRNRYFSEEPPSEAKSQCGMGRMTRMPIKLRNIRGVEKNIFRGSGSTTHLWEEVCRCKNEDCSDGLVVESGIMFMCRQKFIEVNLMVIEQNRETSFDAFKMHAKCVCIPVRVKDQKPVATCIGQS